MSPGESIDVPGFFENNGNLGVLEQRIDVMFENGAIRTATIFEDSYATYQVSPQKLNFDDVDVADSETNVSGTLTFHSDSSRLVAAESDSPWLEVGIIDGQPARIITHLILDSLPQGRSIGHIILSTDDQQRPRFSVTCNVNATQALRPAPAQVFLTDASRTAIVQFIRANGEIAKIASLTINGGGISARIMDDGASLFVEAAHSVRERGAIVQITDDRGQRSRVLVTDSQSPN